jgi:hypothetical protein
MLILISVCYVTSTVSILWYMRCSNNINILDAISSIIISFIVQFCTYGGRYYLFINNGFYTLFLIMFIGMLSGRVMADWTIIKGKKT